MKIFNFCYENFPSLENIHRFVSKSIKVTHKKMTKTMADRKKYGTPYSRRYLLKKGDITEIASLTGFSYANVSQQIRGERKMHILVQIAADSIADYVQSKIDSINS